MPKYQRSLFIFRRDLRIEDNTALNAALQSSAEVLPCFIFDPQQASGQQYFASNAFAFMLESLLDLEKQIDSCGGQLCLLQGLPEVVLAELLVKYNFNSIFLNKDYTPFSRARDKAIFEFSNINRVEFHSFSDALLLEPSKFSKPDKTPYTIYTPFYKKASTLPVAKPQKLQAGNFAKVEQLSIKQIKLSDLKTHKVSLANWQGGSTLAHKLLKHSTTLTNYASTRDIPSLAATTNLAPHHKFGTVSIRQTYWQIAEQHGEQHQLIKELYWRDFFTHIAWHFPHVFEGCFHKLYDKLNWNESQANFERWCQGLTGFPIVDAGMRELVFTGQMHNRVRMITASFLVKDLHINWRMGERFFAQHLVDYDPAVNNGNWQWAASTGCDAQPYFRIFNPWRQQQRFDPDCIYIKRWLPELANFSSSEIHQFENNTIAPQGYVMPILDHAVESQIAKDMFADLKENQPSR